MSMFRPHYRHLALAVLAAAFATGAQASPPGEQPPASFGTATPVAQLQTMTGGTDTHVNNITNQESNGTVDNNSNVSIGNGANNISGNAFNSSAGINTAVQNSGNNVLIQNNTIVTVRMQ
ncbi:hypothetical protein L2Y96_05890 [Luteibacter aegosomaticola]|uniref:hypothetical protein n=1 Tax=Luteibacter aegosomaticola TaxID=2911538 RepID=UPI001FFB6638|nr:hypothetical protein [Luteibacter aegosomaticola]UPG91301.1 hypothetical protein L2Y96_05890 [Luteibacter aegosomaticola]